MQKSQNTLYTKFMETPLARSISLTKEEMFHAGCMALKEELERFIDEKLQGYEERKDKFSQGQDDGLRWVRDHLQFIFHGE